MQTEVVIIGAGPAGVAAAVQLSRSGVDFALLEKKSVGGLLNSASCVENFPGFPDGIKGAELALLLASHLKKWNIDPLFREVLSVKFENNLFAVETKSNLIKSKYLIAASGTRANPVPHFIPEEIKYRVHSEISSLLGLSCLNIAVVGGGDAAFDYAINLSAKNKVYILCRSSPRCLPLLYNRARDCEKIKVFEGAELGENTFFYGTCPERTEFILRQAQDERIVNRRVRNDDGAGISVRFKIEGKTRNLNVNHVLFAIGREPDADYLRNLNLNDIETLQRKGRLFLCGDVKNKRARQAVIAAGDGLKAAMCIILNKN